MNFDRTIDRPSHIPRHQTAKPIYCSELNNSCFLFPNTPTNPCLRLAQNISMTKQTSARYGDNPPGSDKNLLPPTKTVLSATVSADL